MAKFKPGESGNVNGRPPGTDDRRREARKLLESHREPLIKKAVELALDGDTTALRICIDRIVPALRPKDAPILLAKPEGQLSDYGRTVLEAMAAGDISPDEGSTVMGVIAAQARIVEVDELERRVAALEGNGEKQNGSD
jgi:hypothetical protein